MSELQIPFVNSQTDDRGICTISFFHPKSNSLTSTQLAELVSAIDKFGKDQSVKIIILRGGGEKTFCAGASFDELMSLKDLDQSEIFFQGFAQVINAMRKCPKLMIGVIHGKAVGGGVGLAAASDYCFATNEASVRLSEISIGLGPFVIEPAITRKIGVSGFTELTLNPGKFFDAKWCERKGLFQQVFSTPSELESELEIFISNLISQSQESLKALKKVFWKDTSHWDELLLQNAAISARLALSEATQNALKAFKKK